MKKILIMFLLSFPILIFAIVAFSSTIIAYYVPLAVNSITIEEGIDIISTEKGEQFNLKFRIGPEGARNTSFKIYDEESRLLVDYNDEFIDPTIYDIEETIIRFKVEDRADFDKKGLISLVVETHNYGFTRLTIVTDDGSYEAYSDIYIADPLAEPGEISGIVFDYTEIHKDYLFGTENFVTLGYTYFPKKALDKDISGNPIIEEYQLQINNLLKQNAQNLEFNFKNIISRGHNVLGDGRGELTLELRPNAQIESKNLSRNASFSFNVSNGYNVYTIEQLNLVKGYGEKIFLLNNILLNDFLTFSNGTKLYGNGFKLDHSQADYYLDDEGNIINNGRYAIEFSGHNSGLYNTHIIGALDENNQPFENITNVGMIAKTNNDRFMEVKDSIIENGRINLTIRGFSHTGEGLDRTERGTHFIVDNNILIGSFITAIEVDSNPNVEAALRYATVLDLSRARISYTAIGMIIQNSRNGGGTIIVNLKEVNNEAPIYSSSWRNLDDATGAFSMSNFGYVLKELKSNKYSDVFYREGKNYYVNPIIMIRGGATNYGHIEFTEDLLETIIKKERPLNIFEAELLGGPSKFIVYLVKPEHFERG